jgi:dTDP-4-amino-4,6-dideoxygalactose transaminase
MLREPQDERHHATELMDQSTERSRFAKADMSVPLLDLQREYRRIAGELRRIWDGTLDRMQLLGGVQVAEFEREIARYIGVGFARGVASGSDALLLGLSAVGVGRGDRVILPANAFIADLEAIHHLGAQPVLVDVATEGFAPDPGAIAAALPAKAILIVHLYGAAFDLAEISTLCARTGTSLVEDGSHSHGARRRDRSVGSFGAVGCFSAGVVKNLSAYGDAGFVTTDRPEVAEQVGLLRQHGQRQKNDHLLYGYNSRLDELQAAVLRIKLRHLDARNERRRKIAAFYDERLAALGVRVPPVGIDETPVYHQYVIRTEQRDALQRHLNENGVQTGIHYPRPLHLQEAWSRTYATTPSFPRAERLAAEILSLPVFPELTDAEVESVVQAVESFFVTRRRAVRAGDGVGGRAPAPD